MEIFSNKEIPEETALSVNNALLCGRLPQSILISGGSEKLRAECAMEIASSVMCEDMKNGGYCGKCRACRKIKAGVHPDVIKVKPQDSKKTLSIETVRRTVLENLYVSPNESDSKVYIIEDGDNLSVQVQNSLLKTLEEPPENVMFIICCEQRENLLVTIISRLTEFNLGGTLAVEGQNDNSLDIAKNLANAVSSENEFVLMMKCAAFSKNRRLAAKTAENMITIIRDALCEGSGAKELSGCEMAAYALRRNFENSSLLKMKTVLNNIISDAENNANENLLVSRFSSELAVIMKERIS